MDRLQVAPESRMDRMEVRMEARMDAASRCAWSAGSRADLGSIKQRLSRIEGWIAGRFGEEPVSSA